MRRVITQEASPARVRSTAMACGVVAQGPSPPRTRARVAKERMLTAREARANFMAAGMVGGKIACWGGVALPKSAEGRLILLMLVVIPSLIIVWVIWANRAGDSAKSYASRFSRNDYFKGKIVVTILETQPAPGRDLAVVINLDRGEIAESAGTQLSDEVGSAGGRLGEDDCKRMTQIPAPDQTLVAYCMVRGNGYSVGLRDLTVPSDGRVWSPAKGWAVGGVIWGGNSDFVAVLLEHERTDLSPLGLLSMSSGHPIQLDTFKVTLLSRNLDHQLELPVVRKDSSGWARINWKP
jgi:hypothetical protein